MKQHDGSAFVVRTYSLLASAVLAIFGVEQGVRYGSWGLGIVEICGSLLFLGNAIIATSVHFAEFARDTFLSLVLAFDILMLMTGGVQGTGIYWFFVMPVSAFFFGGKRGGLWWMIATAGIVLLLWELNQLHIVILAYDWMAIRQLLVSLTAVSAGLYVYQHVRENLEQQGTQNRSALRQERIRSDVIIQNITEGVIATDTEGKVLFANAVAARLLGWSEKDLLGKRFTDIVPMIDAWHTEVSRESRPLYRAIHDNAPVSTFATYRAKDGSLLPAAVTSVPIVDNNIVVGAISTFRDATEEQSVVRAKSEFVTLASHQLRTPLSAVSWMSELLLNGDSGKLTPEQHEHVESIYQSARRMNDVIAEMLTVSSLELNALPVRPKPTKIPDILRYHLKKQLAAFPDKNIEVREKYEQNLPQIPCDEEMMHLLLGNLLSNAIKYTPDNGSVTITVRTTDKQKLTPHSKGSVVITVKDTGYGIPKDVTNKIFSKFFRAKNIINKDTDGTGLGLYIVKAVLDYVGGSISFESEEDEGTVFTLLLPLEGMRARQVEPKSIL